MLQIICLVHRTHGAMPQRRTELYEEVHQGAAAEVGRGQGAGGVPDRGRGPPGASPAGPVAARGGEPHARGRRGSQAGDRPASGPRQAGDAGKGRRAVGPRADQRPGPQRAVRGFRRGPLRVPAFELPGIPGRRGDRQAGPAQPAGRTVRPQLVARADAAGPGHGRPAIPGGVVGRADPFTAVPAAPGSGPDLHARSVGAEHRAAGRGARRPQLALARAARLRAVSA